MTSQRELTWALRRLRRHPTYFAASVLIFSLAIGASLALMTIVQVVFKTPLPYPQPDNLVIIQKRKSANQDLVGLSPAEALELREVVGSAGQIGAVRYGSAILEGTKVPLRVVTAQVTPNLWGILGVNPSSGSLPRERFRDRAVVAESFWRSRLGSGDAASKPLRMGNLSYAVAGVIPDLVLGPPGIPMPELLLDLDLRSASRAGDLFVFARLAESSQLSWLRQRLQSFSLQMSSSRRGYEGVQFDAKPLGEYAVGPFTEVFRTLGWALLFFVGASIVNIGGLNLTRALQRRQGFSIQMALGAGQKRLAAGMVLETLGCSLIGLVGGLLLAEWLLAGVRASAGDWLPRVNAMSLNFDFQFMAAIFLATLATALVCSLLPFWFVSKVCAAGDLARSDLRSQVAGAQGKRTRNVLRRPASRRRTAALDRSSPPGHEPVETDPSGIGAQDDESRLQNRFAATRRSLQRDSVEAHLLEVPFGNCECPASG